MVHTTHPISAHRILKVRLRILHMTIYLNMDLLTSFFLLGNLGDEINIIGISIITSSID